MSQLGVAPLAGRRPFAQVGRLRWQPVALNTLETALDITGEGELCLLAGYTGNRDLLRITVDGILIVDESGGWEDMVGGHAQTTVPGPVSSWMFRESLLVEASLTNASASVNLQWGLY